MAVAPKARPGASGGRESDTRLRILVEASRLFAERGYHGTSTRDIAEAVGIRQPSLYSHFAMKHLILAELLDADLVPALRRVRAALALEGSPAARLHAYLHADVDAIMRLPYDVRGLYNDEVLRSTELTRQARLRERMHDLTRRLVRAGIAAGELIDTDPGFVQHAITGMLLEAVRERGPDPAGFQEGLARTVADFVLRALLVDPASLPEVRASSDRLFDLVAGHSIDPDSANF